MSFCYSSPAGKLKPARKVIFNIESPYKTMILSRFEQDFQILRVIGAGHFGKVYECKNTLDGLLYAVKVTNHVVNRGQIDFALNEAVALASVGALNENNYIVRYVNCWIENSKLHLAMELCKGSLKGLISDGKLVFTEILARKVLRDLCKALKYIHEENIVH
jgi:serine/threonine protein kinase